MLAPLIVYWRENSEMLAALIGCRRDGFTMLPALFGYCRVRSEMLAALCVCNLENLAM